MAYICEKPAGSCNTCEHYRFDDDYGAKACFAEVDVLEVGNICTYSFGTENASRATVKITKLLPASAAAVVMFLNVEKDDTGNGLFDYLIKTGKTMNASVKYLTKVAHGTVCNVPYVSVWDGGTFVETTADVRLDTKQVFNIKTVDVGESVDALDREYIMLGGKEWPVFEKSEAADGEFWRS